MPRYLNTDNGQILTVADHEAVHYEAASNFKRVDDVPKPAPAPAPSKPTAAKRHQSAESEKG